MTATRSPTGLPTTLLAAAALTAFLPEAASATWSILAVDLATGRVVVASATCVSQGALRQFPTSSLMAIQAVVVPGAGVAVVQAAPDRTLANQRLIAEQLRGGTEPRMILDMLREDPDVAERQFGIVDLSGRGITFTGSENRPAALGRQGRIEGTDVHYAVQGNIVASDEVVLAAVRALGDTEGDVLDRVMAAMEAADVAGGDRRCTCETQPTPDAPCDGKNAHVAYLLAADRSDPADRPFLYLDVTDENVQPDENANPVVTLRLRYDAWKAGQ